MKRLINIKCNLNSQYDTGDIIKDLNISNLLISENSLEMAYHDFSGGRRSMTSGPISVWIYNDEIILVDGYHRIAEYLLKDIQFCDAEVTDIGYSDYWVKPSDKFVVDFNLKYNGLENIIDEELLEYDKDELMDE